MLLLIVTMNAHADTTLLSDSRLDNVEMQAIKDASDSELISLNECLNDNETPSLSDTSCINDILGDVHN